MTFTHENVTGRQCDSIVGASCTPYGVPTHENDVIALRLALDIDMTVTSFFMSFGLLDRVDIGVVLPIVSTSLRGTSDAQIIPFGTPAQHFFGGTSANPQLSTSRFVEGSAHGIGDIAARVKVNVTQSERTTFAVLGERGADRKSTRLNSSHGYISYAVFCLKKKKSQDIRGS